MVDRDLEVATAKVDKGIGREDFLRFANNVNEAIASLTNSVRGEVENIKK